MPMLGIAGAGSVGVVDTKAPVDTETKSALIDEERPGKEETFFAIGIEARLQDFVQSVRHREQLLAAGVTTPTRLLIHGPPGCGKTLLARRLAFELALPLLTVRCDALISSLLGQTGRNLRQVFDYAAGRPCVLFLDEFDALAKARGHASEVGELQRVVISLLQNLDALPEDTVVVAATNHEELLDRAIWRRFAFVMPIGAPSVEQRTKIWSHALRSMRAEPRDYEILAMFSEGLSGAAIQTAAFDAVRDAVIKGCHTISLPATMRRLGAHIRLIQGARPLELDDEIRWLRDWAPKIFTWKILSDLFGVSQRQIQKLIGDKEVHERSKQADH